MDIRVKLAQKALAYYLEKHDILPTPDSLNKELLNEKAGVFVSLHTQDGSLRGCIGTILPTRDNLAQEIIHNAISAGFNDDRFEPINRTDLSDLLISIDVLSKPEEVSSIKDLNHKKYGIIVEGSNNQTGVLLPDIPGVESVEQQIAIACQKAGIDFAKQEILIYRFTVNRYC